MRYYDREKFDLYVITLREGNIENPNITIHYKDKATMAKLWDMSAEESLDYLLTNEMGYKGNIILRIQESCGLFIFQGDYSGLRIQDCW